VTTLIYIENVLGSGQVVSLTEDFSDYSVSRDLRPGEHARLVVSPFKIISVNDVSNCGRAQTLACANEAERSAGPPGPALLQRRYG
jgi:hypothetical protein